MNKVHNIFKGDKVIWMIFFFLCMISVTEVFSASSFLTYGSENFSGPILKHAAFLLGGTCVAIIVMSIPCRYFKVLIPFLLILSVVTLIWALLMGKINGAGRWVKLLGFTFQPSEIAKCTIIITVAQILSVMQLEKGADKRAFSYILTVVGILTFLIVFENLSTAMLIFVVVVMMMFIGRIPWSQMSKLVGAVAVVGVMTFLFIWMTGDASGEGMKTDGKTYVEQVADNGNVEVSKKEKNLFEKVTHRSSVWKKRIIKFVTPNNLKPEEWDLDADGQVGHANIAIATSNIVGRGPGNSVERDWLSQAFSDFIYAIIIEEMGLLGGVFVVFLYIVLLYRAARIARQCERSFPAFLVMGLALMLVTQALFNMMVAVGLAPVTGQPLPLISKGGTSTLINCAYIGMILSVSRTAKKRGEKAVEEKTGQHIDVEE